MINDSILICEIKSHTDIYILRESVWYHIEEDIEKPPNGNSISNKDGNYTQDRSFQVLDQNETIDELWIQMS